MNRRDALRSLLTLPAVGSVAVAHVTPADTMLSVEQVRAREALKPMAIEWTHLGPSKVKGFRPRDPRPTG